MSPRSFPSKVDGWLAMLVLAALMTPLSLSLLLLLSGQWLPALQLAGGLLFSLGMLILLGWPVRYDVEADRILIHHGRMTLTLTLAEIERVEPCSSLLLGAPAWSRHRLRLVCRERSVMISPEDIDGFLDAYREAKAAGTHAAERGEG